MRGGFLSSFSVPGAGMLTRVDPNCPAGHGDGKGVVGVACALPQNKPAWNSWSGVSPLAVRSTGPPSETGTAPATRPLSYRQLKPSHGPFSLVGFGFDSSWLTFCRCRLGMG